MLRFFRASFVVFILALCIVTAILFNQLTLYTSLAKQSIAINQQTNQQLAGINLKLLALQPAPTTQPVAIAPTTQPAHVDPHKQLLAQSSSRWHPIDATYTHVLTPIGHGTVWTLQKVHIMKKPPVSVAQAN